MAIHFTYEDEEIKPDEELRQGDLIQITDEIREVLKEYHPHYASNPNYTFLILITQSCDLAFRSGKCASRYLNLAAVRPLETLIEQELERQCTSSIEKGLYIFPNKKRRWMEDFLEKLFNNNLPGYFYIEAESALNIDKAHAVYLALSIAIKSDNYEICKKARFGQLKEIFRAKLGWLVGNMYSRVATEDWVPTRLIDEDFEQKINQTLDDSALWVDEVAFERLKSEQNRRRVELNNKHYYLIDEEIEKVINEYTMEKRRKKEDIAKLLVEQTSSVIEGIDGETLKELEYRLLNNIELEKLIT